MGIILLIIFFPLIIMGICLVAMGGFAAKESYEKNNVTSQEKEKIITTIKEKRKKQLDSHNIERFNQEIGAATYEDLFAEVDKLHIEKMAAIKESLRQVVQLLASEAAKLDTSILEYNLTAESLNLSVGLWVSYGTITPHFTKQSFARINAKTVSFPELLCANLRLISSSAFWESIVLSKGFDYANRYAEELYKILQEEFSKKGLNYYVIRKSSKHSMLFDAWMLGRSGESIVFKDSCDMSHIFEGIIKGRCTSTR